MFWWHKAAQALRTGGTRRLGLITTDSLRQTFNRRVLEPHLTDPKNPVSLVLAIPDHPWVDAGDSAAVRIAMTVAAPGTRPGRLLTVTGEQKAPAGAEGRTVTLSVAEGRIFANLRIGADVAGAQPLRANGGLASPGVKLHGAGFIVTPDRARTLGLGTVPGLDHHIRTYRNGRDLMATPRGVMVIDNYPLSQAELRDRFPAVFQHVYDNVRPEREQNRQLFRRKNWHWFGATHETYRSFTKNLPRYIATVETTKHRIFQFLDADTLADNMLIAIGLSDAADLAVLSSRVHVAWALAAGGTLGGGPRYTKTKCFDPFPFPDLPPARRARLRDMGEELDTHRKARQAEHPNLTLTQIYNVVDKLRAGERIEGKDKQVYDQGLCGLLHDIHTRIDAAVANAYGWPADLPEAEILHRLTALNRARTAEEARGHIRWLRPEYQNPTGTTAQTGGADQAAMQIATGDKTAKPPFPKALPEQIAAVRAALAELGTAGADQIARQFKGTGPATVQPLLESLAALGQARTLHNNRFALAGGVAG